MHLINLGSNYNLVTYLFKTHHTLVQSHVDKAQVCIISLINGFALWKWGGKHWVWRKE